MIICSPRDASLSWCFSEKTTFSTTLLLCEFQQSCTVFGNLLEGIPEKMGGKITRMKDNGEDLRPFYMFRDCRHSGAVSLLVRMGIQPPPLSTLTLF